MYNGLTTKGLDNVLQTDMYVLTIL